MTQLPATEAAKPADNLVTSLFSQFFGGPAYLEVATRLLKVSLKELYPALDIDPNNAAIGEPQWDIVNGEVVELFTNYETLSDMLCQLAILRTSIMLIEGHHYLTQRPVATPAVHLPVQIEEIARLLNELSPTVLIACQEQQLAYWNASHDASGPRWEALANTLRGFWNAQQIEGWTATECSMARALFFHPDDQERQSNSNPYDTHAYLIDIDAVENGQVEHVNEVAIAVLIGKIENKEVILTHSLRYGYERFDSQEALGASLGGQLLQLGRKKIQWRLYEPSGDFFSHYALQMIDMQINAIDAFGFAYETTTNDAEAPQDKQFASNIGKNKTNLDLGWVEDQLPDWLQNASSADQISFARHLKSLSALNSSHAGKTYQDDIPSISDFALTALKNRMQLEHPEAATLDLQKIEIEVRTVVAWGSFIVPGQIETTRFNILELAMQNLIAVPFGDKAIRSLDKSTPLPEWMTVAYIESLISEIDVGRTYPALIKRTLLDDPAQSQRRQELYTSQLRIQLPLLALQNKLRDVGGLDERGCRYVNALMEPNEADRKVDGQTIVLRKLAFVRQLQLGVSEDVVTNMFVIGPQDPDAGPCVLYQPMLEPQLCQYPSPSNLLYAIRQTASLRRSVLAWLPDAVRTAYSRYVFPRSMPSPWIVVDFITSPLASLADIGPVALSRNFVGGDFLPVLFKANASALVELADRQSVSDSESGWASFKQAGWMIFNLALPFLGSTAGTAAWIWQILDDIEQITQDDEKTDALAKWEAIVDVLLNLALAITTHAIDRTRTGNTKRQKALGGTLKETPQDTPKPVGVVEPKLVIEQLAPASYTEQTPGHYGVIHTYGALSTTPERLAKLLSSFNIKEPKEIGEPETEGVFQGLYEKDGSRYAKVDAKWFKVQAQGDQVFIVDARNLERTGPPLASDAHGQWRIDTSLRLRGDGSAGAKRRIRSDAVRRSAVLLAKLNRFEHTKPEKQVLLTQDVEAWNSASGIAKEDKRLAYLSTLKTQRESYEEALLTLIEWPAFESAPNYTGTRLSYLNAQVNFTFAEIGLLQERLTPILTKALNIVEAQDLMLEQQHIDDAQLMVTLSEDMIERLDYMQTRFERLKALGRKGCAFVKEHQGKLPSYTSDQLRLLQLDMYRHLCLTPDSLKTMPEGWEEVRQIVDNLTVACQALQDAVSEQSVIRLDEQIDALNSLTEQFTAIDEHLNYAAEEYKDSARPEQITRVSKRIELLKKRAARHLEGALDERSNLRRQPGPYMQRPRPRRKFIRARFWGMVSGEPRLSNTGEETDLLDVKNPITEQIIVTFHRKATGEWVPREKPGQPSVIPTLKISVAKGSALISGLEAFKAQAEAQALRPNRTPTGTGLIMHAHARRLLTISNAIKRALTQAQNNLSNETFETANTITPAERSSADTVRFRLESEARDLHILGYEIEQKITKQSPPTMSRVIWLRDRNLISITKQMTRRRIKGMDYDYLDRYEIKDKQTNKALWFADFHYSKSWLADHFFFSARLKTPEEINQGKTADSGGRLSQRQLIKFYRSTIAVDQAKDVFFAKEPS
jgi:hypothetical protein